MALARRIGGEIVNFDSVQLYRGFDIGSAKPPATERQIVPHHLFDLLEPEDEWNAAEFARLAREVAGEIAARRRVPIFVGGTGFYARALFAPLPQMPGRDEAIRRRLATARARRRGPARLHAWLARVDPATAARVSPADAHRVERALEVYVLSGRPISSWKRPEPGPVPGLFKFGLELPRAELNERLDRRVDAMYDAGLVEETAALLARHSAASRPFGAIGYAEAAAVVHGGMSEQAAREETKRRTRAYAKRQLTWFRSEPDVRWLDARRDAAVLAGEIAGELQRASFLQEGADRPG
jgi:tRNA dimethylallyltransferase